MFLQEFAKGAAVHLQDLLTRMKACVKNAYNIPTADLNQSGEQQI
jgi:hypothetical protein